MEMTKLEKKIINFLIKHKNFLFLCFMTVAAVMLRVSLYNKETGDFIGCLEPWVNEYIKYGGVAGLKYNIGNYNCLYNYILSLISYLPINSLYSIKSVSVIFDIVCAVFGYKIGYLVTNNKQNASIIYCAILFAPTCFLNSGAWAQCDSIYTSFAIISIYYLLKEKFTLSFIFAGISFAFKLQFVFILPVYIIYYICKKKFSIINFLLIPLVNLITAIPAILLGRDIKDILMIYLNQAQTYSNYSLKFPNIYYILVDNAHLKYLGMILCVVAFAVILFIIIDRKIKLDQKNILLLCCISVITATYFLPYMHERYMFMADLFSIIWYLCQKNKKYLYFPIAINLISLLSYLGFLFKFTLIDFPILSLIYLIILIKFGYDISIFNHKSSIKN